MMPNGENIVLRMLYLNNMGFNPFLTQSDQVCEKKHEPKTMVSYALVHFFSVSKKCRALQWSYCERQLDARLTFPCGCTGKWPY